MSLRVYNTLTREKELFDPVTPGKVGMYLCGPTVYKPPHIGHMVGPVIFDAIKRYLLYKGFAVTWVVNITDVDDKLIDAAAKRNTSVTALAERYTEEYLGVLKELGIDTIDRFPKASEHMAEMIAMCQTLIAKGHAYAAGGNVWFDVTADADYGKLSNRRVEEQESGLRDLEGAGKRNPADFALWKAAKPGEPAWDSPWGQGRPGWHIECSAMATKYLGDTFDIHGGGMDLMFPHHENELAQSECATGKTFAKYWLHNGLTKIKTKLASGEWADEKMSGSLGNVVGARELLDAHGPELLRFMLLRTHYRRPIDFSDEVLADARKGLAQFHRLFERIGRLHGTAGNAAGAIPADATEMDRAAGPLMDTPLAPFVREVLAGKMKFLEVMDDDFNTAAAIACLHELASATNSFVEAQKIEQSKAPDAVAAATAAAQTIRNLGLVLGLFRAPARKEPAKDQGLTEPLMQLLIQVRNDARKAKNFATADAIRDGLTKLKITLEDRSEGTVWRRE